jgi:hypothetical protein
MKSGGFVLLIALSLFISLTLPAALAADYYCDDCNDCNNELKTKSPGDRIILKFDASVSGDCINQSTGNDGLIFDCDGKKITGDGTGTGIAANKVLEIRNCIVTNFYRGIHLNLSSGNVVTDSNVSYNYNGIRIRSGSNEVRNTFIIHNTNGLSIATTSSGNEIYNNYLDNTKNAVFGSPPQLSGWSVSKTTGTNIIGGPYIGGNYWSDYVLTTDDDDDGMGDTPYTVNVSGSTTNQDSLPLVYDEFPPILSYVEPPTPANGETLYSGSITVRIQSNENLSECTFNWYNGSWTYIAHVPGTDKKVCEYTLFTDNDDDTHYFSVGAKDTDGNTETSSQRSLSFDFTGLPLSFAGPTPQNNSYTNTGSFTINASSSGTLTSCTLEWNGENETVSPSGSHCVRTKSGLTDGSYTFRMYATDDNERSASTPARKVTVDTILNIEYDPATPANDSMTGNEWVYVKVNSDIPLSWCKLSLDGINETMSVSGTSCYKNRTGLEDQTSYTFKVYVNDTLGKQNSTKLRTFRVDTTGPNITVHTVTPVQVAVGGDITMNISASDEDGMDEVWVIVTKPDDSTERVDMVNGVAKNYTVASAGNYTITFYAKDTAGSTSSVSHVIKANPIVQFSSTIGFGNETSPVSMKLYLPGTSTLINSFTASNGVFTDKDVVDGVYDIRFQTFDDTLLVVLSDVDIGSDNGKTMKLDRVTPPASGFAYTYAVESPYTISSAVIRIYYDEDDDAFASEEGLELFRCAQWNFTGRACAGSWSKINYTLWTSGDYIEAEVTSFSGFSVKQGSYCGDGVCDSPDETPTTCSSDCVCVPQSTRPCRVAHLGICAEGTETCTSQGEWSGCPSPGTETCNGLDDDCDGVIDNVGGKTSALATKCGCYGGEYATPETCNGIDDDCDGKIDDGSDCCSPGDKKECGTSLTTGICQPGTATCVDGIWGECVGAVTPMSETCGNSLDDDCDGQIDDGCAAYPVCDEGRISASCICGGEVTDYGYCCGGIIYVDGCPSSSGWWILVAIGVVVLIVLYLLVAYFKSQGKELSWESVTGKYAASERKEPQYGGKLSSEEEMEKFESGKEDLKEQPDVFDELKKKDKGKK